ncbi:MAG: replication-associated recombination protein A [Proteobacteria bacterium]|nr:replication-associated recombination protein A [Pseudomonadota bacterium]
MSFSAPLAERMRAKQLDEVLGQQHLLAKGKPLAQMVERNRLQSMILWGPPGTGKTSLARLLADASGAHWRAISAVHDGVKEIKRMIDEAKADQALGQRSVLFVDEIHRFNKAQQDALLPVVESGLLTLIGATTENPSFALNNALLSRARVYVLKSLSTTDLVLLLARGLNQLAHEQGWQSITLDEQAQPWILAYADGDGRKLLNMLEQLTDFAEPIDDDHALAMQISAEAVKTTLTGGQVRRFDREGEQFYDQISALHKAVRGSSVDAALYWFARMLDGGCDPLYLARRLVRMASEEIANADPRALTVALDALNSYQVLGSPEGELALAQAVTYLATAPKSNAVYMAYKAVRKAVATMPSYDVPLHLRNAPTKLMASLDYGKGYRYAHDEPHAYAAGENYFPEALQGQAIHFYQPVDRGYEQTIQQRMQFWQQLDQSEKGGSL